MEKQLPHAPMLSLQEMALRKVAVVLWISEPLTFSFNSRINTVLDRLRYWQKTVDSKALNLSDKLSKLQLPETLAKEMMRVVKPIGLQIIRWKFFHEDYFNAPNQILDGSGLTMAKLEWLEASLSMAQQEFLDVPFLKQFQWTAVGTIDYRKTAEELVRCRVFDIVKRYKLASLYCLDHYIPELWKELPEENRRHFSTETPHITELSLHSCWPYILKGEEYKLDGMVEDSISFNQFAFERSSSKGNKAAAKYFLQRLSPEEREASLVRAAKSALRSLNTRLDLYPTPFSRANISDVVFYLVSEMTHEQETQILRESPADVFGCFLDWPYQDAFLDFAVAMWAWLQCEDLENRARNYDSLLHNLMCGLSNSDHSLPNFFQNIFMSSPSEFRKHFAERECRWFIFFRNLFESNEAKAANVILSNLDAADRFRLASSIRMLSIFDYSICEGEGHLVETCLRDSGLTREEKVSLKKAFIELKESRTGEAIEREGWRYRRFFEFLDETDAGTET